MHYKALMVDVDGTLIPYDGHTLPSEKVTRSLQEAAKYLTVCLVTGRSSSFVEPILDSLRIKTGLAVLNNGAQVIDLGTRKILYQKAMLADDVAEVASYLGKESIAFYFNEFPNKEKEKTILKIVTDKVYPESTLDKITTHLSHIPSIVISRISQRDPNKFGLLITHVQATKQNGILVVADHLGIHTHNMIGIGDGDNDFPMLMACGLKVAMGNAVADLKTIADYIAPSVEDDGVADAIEKFILKPQDK